MKPKNHHPDLLLADGAPVRCRFVSLSEECEQNATTLLSHDEVVAFERWLLLNPKAIIQLDISSRTNCYLCDAHQDIVKGLADQMVMDEWIEPRRPRT